MRLPALTFWLAAILLPLSSHLAAADSPSAVPGVDSSSFMQGLLGLLVVVAVILAIAWVLRRFNLAGATGNAAGMKIVSGLSLGPRERILLLEVADAWIVVGVTASQMRTLHTLPKGKLPDAEGPDQATAFSQLLKQFANRRDAR